MTILLGWMAPDDGISAGSMGRHPTNPLLLYLPSAGSPIRDGVFKGGGAVGQPNA